MAPWKSAGAALEFLLKLPAADGREVPMHQCLAGLCDGCAENVWGESLGVHASKSTQSVEIVSVARGIEKSTPTIVASSITVFFFFLIPIIRSINHTSIFFADFAMLNPLLWLKWRSR